MAEQNAKPDWKVRLSAELRRDKKKTIVLVTITLVAAVMGGRLLVKSVHPSKAEANVGSTAVVASGGTETPAMPTFEPGSRDPKRPAVVLHPVRPEIKRDIFCFRADQYPLLVAPGRVKDDEPEKRPKTPEVDPAQLRRARIRRQARALVLQSTIVGESPAAIINGRVMHVGRVTHGFRIVSVTSRNCVVEKEGVRITLEMAGWRGSPSGRTDGEE